MESIKHSLVVARSQTLPHSPPNEPNPIRIARAHRSLTVTAVIGLIGFITFIPVISDATPPKHANEQANIQFVHNILPTNIRLERGNPTEDWARGRILVMPRAGLPAKAFANILKEHDGKARKIGQSNLYIVDLPEYTEEGVITILRHHPHLKFAELDRAVYPALIPNDPYYTNEWHLPKIGAPLAWDSSQGEGITIAILDSGIDSAHPDLAAQIVPGWNFYDNNSDTTDIYGHGTRVAGTAAAIGNNGIGVAGVASQSKIMPLRITDTNGYGYYSMIAQGLSYAADHGARIANVSFQDMTSSYSVRSAAQYLKDKGGLVMVSGGNTGKLENYTVTTSMIPVAATDVNDNRKIFSSYGDYIALAAPGDTIWSTQRGGDYVKSTGTSFASPVAAGVVALMMAANPELGSSEIENLLFSTAVDLGETGRDPFYGYGRVDAAAAVQAAMIATPTIDIQPPNVSIIDPLSGATVSGLIPVEIEAIDNVGVTHAELWVNNTNVAVDTSEPFAFTWDSNGAVNGKAELFVRVFDAANNTATSNIEVTVDNPIYPHLVDTEPPVIEITNPVEGNVSGTITITVNASDNNNTNEIMISIYINDSLKAIGTGSALSTTWNTRAKGNKPGKNIIRAIATDTTGNTASTFVTVNVVK